MIEIPKQLIDNVLQPYRVNCRYLKSAALEYLKIRGIFEIKEAYYYNPSFEHATDVEIQLYLNQLIYAGIAEAIKGKLFPELEELDFEGLQKESMLIIESRKRFRRAIQTNTEIAGKIRIKELKNLPELLLVYVDFQFENRNCFGSLELALIKPNGEQK